MSSRIETTRRAATPVWARVALGLLAMAGLAALAVLRPSMPALPWQPLQPTSEELVRQTIVFVVWLLLLAICARFAWLALKPPRRLEPTRHVPPSWLPEHRRAPLVSQRPDARELLQLFRRPETAALPEAATAAPDSPGNVMPAAKAEVGGSAEAPVAVCLFGRLRIGADAQGASERATRGLIVYLVIKRAPATMDELVEALWPGQNPVKTRQRLWKAKRQAQQLLGNALVRERDGYAIDRTRMRTDLDELDALRAAAPLRADELERAVTLAREDPLADVDYPWADGERRRLQAIQSELLEQLAAIRLEDNDASGALAAAERLIRLDPLNERGWCLAMEAEGALGNRQAILDRYEQLGRELDERLGLRPGNGVNETYRRLLSQP